MKHPEWTRLLLEAWGEVQGVMTLAGTMRGKPGIGIRSHQYGQVWCVIPPELMAGFRHECRIEELWKGRTLGVEGRLFYAAGGKLKRILVTNIREIEDAPFVDLDTVADPDFTAGLDPAEYLR